MAAVARLLTIVDIADEDDDGPDARRMSVSARHEAVLADGRRVVLLDDRGWTEQVAGVYEDEELPGVWALKTVEEIERTARTVVGPDEPFDDRTPADMEAGHWDSLARVLRHQGIEVDAEDLGALPHEVELSDRVLERVGGRP